MHKRALILHLINEDVKIKITFFAKSLSQKCYLCLQRKAKKNAINLNSICFLSMTKDFKSNFSFAENVIILDADYIDKVAFDLIVNFERMIQRRIPRADMARWIDCVALDGGLREGQHKTQVILIHDKEKTKMENFVPSDFEKELSQKAFLDNLGEFTLNSYPVEDIVGKEDFFIDVLKYVCSLNEVKRVMVIPNAESYYNKVREALKLQKEEKTITVFAMQPMMGGNFRQEILGYSLMSALGIKADELNSKN